MAGEVEARGTEDGKPATYAGTRDRIAAAQAASNSGFARSLKGASSAAAHWASWP